MLASAPVLLCDLPSEPKHRANIALAPPSHPRPRLRLVTMHVWPPRPGFSHRLETSLLHSCPVLDCLFPILPPTTHLPLLPSLTYLSTLSKYTKNIYQRHVRKKQASLHCRHAACTAANCSLGLQRIYPCTRAQDSLGIKSSTSNSNFLQ